MDKSKKPFYMTTTDNPFNYFTEYENWERYDTDYDYHTNEIVARLANTSIGIPDEINNDLTMMAIDDFLEVALPMINSDGKEVRFTRCYEP